MSRPGLSNHASPIPTWSTIEQRNCNQRLGRANRIPCWGIASEFLAEFRAEGRVAIDVTARATVAGLFSKLLVEGLCASLMWVVRQLIFLFRLLMELFRHALVRQR